MSDDLEQRLQQAFQTGSLPPAPASLLEALDRVPDVPVRSRRSMSRRSTFGLLAAALLVATVGALAIGGGSPRPGPTVPTMAPTSSPATATGLRLEYQWFDGFHPELATTISIIEGRIASTGVVGATVEAEGTDRIVVTLPGTADADAGSIRRLIGQTGRVDFVPLGQTHVSEGQTIDRGRHPPMFSGDEVASAIVGADQNGQPTIDVILSRREHVSSPSTPPRMSGATSRSPWTMWSSPPRSSRTRSRTGRSRSPVGASTDLMPMRPRRSCPTWTRARSRSRSTRSGPNPPVRVRARPSLTLT